MQGRECIPHSWGQTGEMDEATEDHSLLKELARRVAALEENVAFLEVWCEKQQDTLDVVAGPWSEQDHPLGLRLVDLRDGDAGRDESLDRGEEARP